MFGIIDIIVLAVLVISILFALYRGLVRELLGISSWILAAFAALYSYDPLQKLLSGHVQNLRLASICWAVFVALVVMIIMTIINARITHKLRKSSLSGLDRILGFIFGIARAGLIIALVYLLGSSFVLTKDQIEKLTQENYSMSYIRLSSNWLESLLPDSIQKDLKSYDPEKVKKNLQVTKEVIQEYDQEDRQALDKLITNVTEGGEEE